MPYVLDIMEELIPCSVLDVGCGRGTIGKIIKNELPDFELYGIEVYTAYLEDMPEYEMIYIQDYLSEYRNHDNYDLYLFIDVLEHFPRGTAIKIIQFLKALNKKIILSVPIAQKHWHQAEEFEINPYEKHLHNWTTNEVEKVLGMQLVGTQDAIGVFYV
jgi:trans-aconitate methyltransferase